MLVVYTKADEVNTKIKRWLLLVYTKVNKWILVEHIKADIYN